MLDQQLAFPEQVDEALALAKLLDWLLEGGDQAALDAEDLEKVVVKALGFATFVTGVGPLACEVRRASAYLVPTQTHYALPNGANVAGRLDLKQRPA
ncbi:hypothetical protein PFY01_14200 [Brevundimonas vesicularis]|nr:hypothetical protein [Brevundimonas vesicularis]WBT05848.1 hypothetical protein PFY01_14200 [Brevundimonas vesicularis]